MREHERVHEKQLLGSGQTGHLVRSQGNVRVDVSTKYHGLGHCTEMRSEHFGQAENGAEIRDATPVDTVTLKVASDHAGCLRTQRSTTGIAADHRKHVIKAIADTDGNLFVRWRVRVLRDCAWHSHSVGDEEHGQSMLPVATDSVSGRGMSLRLSAGSFHRREATTWEIPGNSDES